MGNDEILKMSKLLQEICLGSYIPGARILKTLGRGLLSSLGIKESKAPGFWRACWCISLQRAVCLLSACGTEALWHSSYLWFLLCFIFDNPLSVRLLAGSYNGIYFHGSHFHDKESQFSFQVGGFSEWVLVKNENRLTSTQLYFLLSAGYCLTNLISLIMSVMTTRVRSSSTSWPT